MKPGEIKFADSGHAVILDGLAQRHRLARVQAFQSKNSACLVATSPADGRVFVKVKGYAKNQANRARVGRAISAIRVASRAGHEFVPRLIESSVVEQDGVYWLAMVSAYAGEPLSRDMFVTGHGAAVDDGVVERLRRSLSAVAATPATTLFYQPAVVARFIEKVFGPRAPRWTSTWTSAHCDLHWGNILDGGRYVVDWDMFALAPQGFDAGSLLLFSASDRSLFDRLYEAFSGILEKPTSRVGVLFAAARLLLITRSGIYPDLARHEPALREGARLILGRRVG